MRVLLFFTFLIALGSSCRRHIGNQGPGTLPGYVPVYADLSQLPSISVESAQPTTKAGKIYAYGHYVFQNDVNKGIHIIDNSSGQQPKKIAFLKIPYSSEIAVKGSYLYTNSIDDLLVFDLQAPQEPVLIKRVKGVFPLINQEYPPFTNVYFECADPKKGIVVDWQFKTVKNPGCKR